MAASSDPSRTIEGWPARASRLRRSLLRSKLGLRVFALYIVASVLPIGLLAYLSREAIDTAVAEATKASLTASAKSSAMSVIGRLQLAQRRLEADAWHASPGASRSARPVGDPRPVFVEQQAVETGSRLAAALSREAQTAPPGLARDRLLVLPEDASAASAGIWMLRQDQGQWRGARLDPEFLFDDLDQVPPGTWLCIAGPRAERLFCSNGAPRDIGAPGDASSHTTRVTRDMFLSTAMQAATWHAIAGVDAAGGGWNNPLSAAMLKAALASVLVAALLSLTQIRRLLGPLDALVRGTKALGAGHFDRPIDLRSDDEFGELANRFNEMASQLQRRMSEQERLARTDSLTGLLNRRGLDLEIQRRLADAPNAQVRRFAVLFIDLDRFKSVNDSLGHRAGDTVLVEVKQRCMHVLPPSTTLARPAGDEFVALVGGADVEALAVATGRMICEALERPFVVETAEFFLGCSVGIALFPEHGADAESLILHADAAMYRSKRAGRRQVSVFDATRDGLGRAEHRLEQELRRGLAENELHLFYQPRIHAATGRTRSVEALIRWNRGATGWVSPGEFIPIAERSQLIVEVGDWVIDTACRQARRWRNAGWIDLTVAINVSARQLHDGALEARLKEAAARHGIPPHCLEIEITESVMVADLPSVSQLLARIREAGFRIALDDFGTGFSSLSYLRQLPFDIIKIDRSFVMDTDQDEMARAIAQSIVAMAKTLGKRTVAEGIETEAQARWLASIGCDELQGFFHGRPVPADALGAHLANSRCRETPAERPGVAA